MSSRDKPNPSKGRVSMPDYSLLHEEVYAKTAGDPTLRSLFKIWHQGSLMEKIYNRRSYFYRAPNWLLIFNVGPTTKARLFINKTLRTIIRIANEKKR